jgi:hypothetical protein
MSLGELCGCEQPPMSPMRGRFGAGTLGLQCWRRLCDVVSRRAK